MAENTDGVVLLYTAKAKPGKEHELKKFLVSLVTGSRHDPGNISYELHEVEGDPTTVFMSSGSRRKLWRRIRRRRL